MLNEISFFVNLDLDLRENAAEQMMHTSDHL